MTATEAVLKVLQGEGRPMHITTLATACIAAGWACKGKNPPQVLYAVLHEYCRKHGDASDIIRLPRSIVALRGMENQASSVEGRKSPGRPKGAKNGFRKPREQDLHVDNERKTNAGEGEETVIIPVHRTCGGCAFIEYDGVREVALKDGVCGLEQLSKRICVKSSSVACSHWRQRSASKIASEQQRAAELYAAVRKLNMSVTAMGGRR